MQTITLKEICLENGTEECPCTKATTNECPACGFLNKSQSCNCSESWAGLCIYQAFLDQK